MANTSANRFRKREFEYLEEKHLLTCLDVPSLAEVRLESPESGGTDNSGLVEGESFEQLGLNETEGSNLVGDIDCDGTVSFKDFLTLCSNFGRENPSFGHGDVDGDNQIGFKDFLQLAANFGSSEESGDDPQAGPDVITLPPVNEIMELTDHSESGDPVWLFGPFPDREWEDGFWCPPCGMG